MKISKSKQELARIISENGGWRDGAESAWFQGINDGNECHEVRFGAYGAAPEFSPGIGFTSYRGKVIATFSSQRFPNWHQTILSREEYFHLYQAPDADGWIEWKGGECPVGEGDLIDVKLSDGDEFFDVGSDWDWGVDAGSCNIIAYRLHKPEQAKPEFCESVMRSIPEPEAKPTIEQLAADYHNAKGFAERKQREADDAKADADEKLRVLEIAGEAHGLLVTPITAKQEPEMVIAVQVGDEVECIKSNISPGKYMGRIGTVSSVDVDDTSTPYLVDFGGDVKIWCHEVKFIRRQ